ncbi:HAMP domain-containing histidine kinase [Rubrivivax albus]|uniref:histidine kinase n=2 Tax=Rubrivivax albus TaxID=2499835 RepID=A0A3S3SE45_9BURK|nr:HAMP domain-containing histidine kinase [Rubrivivax albus]
MPGIEVLANATALLRDGGALRPVPAWGEAIASAAAVAGLVFGFRRVGARRALTVALISVPLAVVASVLSVGVGWAWSPLPFALAAALAYPLWSWRRLEYAMQVLDREIRRLAEEPVLSAEHRVSARPVAPAVDERDLGTDPDPDPDPLARRLDDLARAGASLREARLFLAGALESLPTATLVGDAQGRVALANARAAALFEVETAADLIGLDLGRLIGEFSTDPPTDWPARLAALTPGGTGLTVEVRLGAGHWLLHLAMVDLSARLRLVVSLADLSSVREAQRLREETLAFVSHDLRGPASSMLMLTDLAQQGRLPIPADDLVPEMRRLAARMLALADDFVHAARAQTRPLVPQALDLAALVDEAVAEWRAAAAAAGVALSVQVDADAPLWLDHALATRALANLLSNAVKHAPPGTTVAVRAWRDPAGARIEVVDAGPGLAADQRQALVRGEEALRVGGAGGVGLGLLFVRRVARRHGGSLTGEPGPGGRGECMTLRLPDLCNASAGSGNP